MMKKYKLLLLFLVLAIAGNACRTPEPPPIPSGSKFIWKINSATSQVYLLGSIHLAKAELYPLDSAIEKAYDESNALAVEIDISKVDAFEVLRRSTYQGEETLQKHLKPETYKLLKDYFDKLKIPTMMLSKMKPWMAALTIMQSQLAAKGYNETYGIDKHFIDKASGKKTILELESMKEQLDLFDELDKSSDDFVNYTLNDMDNSLNQVDEMFRAWKSGDALAMEKVLNASLSGSKDFDDISDKMILKRNYKMTDKIEGYLDKPGTYFVIVGSGHLVGKDGIISQLNKTGKYKISQL